MTDKNYQQRVRECAYYLWEHEGRPEGRDEEFWQRALLRIAADEAPPAEHLAAPSHEADDEALHDSFPASDPPSFTATSGTSVPE